MAEIHSTTLVPSKVELLTAWVPTQRWYAAKGRTPALRRVGGYRLDDPAGEVGIEILVVADDSGPGAEPVWYQVPLTYRGAPLAGAEAALVGTMEHGVLGTRWVYDAPHDPVFVRQLVELVQGRAQAQAQSVSHTADPRYAAQPSRSDHRRVVESRVLTGEQSNTSIICQTVDDTGTPAAPLIVKVFRMLQDGDNPDVVLQSALSESGCELVPTALGSVSGPWADDVAVGTGAAGLLPGAPVLRHTHLAFAQDLLPEVQDAWRVALVAAGEGASFAEPARALGAATATVHRELARLFGTTTATAADVNGLRASLADRLEAALAEVPELAPLRDRLEATLRLPDGSLPPLQRVHGDYHLGQVLHTDEGWRLIDFEGEPLRPLAERVLPDLPMRDLAGMLRSFDYAGASASAPQGWVEAAQEAFLAGYRTTLPEQPGEPALLRALLMDKALYEVVYEARNRPDWLPIPLQAVHRLLADHPTPPRKPMEPIQASAQVADYSAVDAFLEGRHSQPHDLLGHHLGPGGLTITAYRPMASSVRAKLGDGTLLDLPHVKGGVWSGTTGAVTQSQDYRLLVNYGDGVEHEQDDPYRFAPSVGEMDRFLFNEGRHEQLWQVLGAHVHSYPGPLGEVWGVSFAVWAPTATAVHVVGDFNGWDRISHPMRLLGPSGIWELFVPGASEGMNYQFAIRGQDTIVRLKADPMAQFAEVAPKQASIVYESHYEWGDDEWMTARRKRDVHHGPMSIYEVHLGSWRQDLGYLGLAEHLVNYVKDLGFTHVEFLPVMEHPYVPSWGYHVTGYYAVSSRWGTPDEFRQLVDYLHRNGIGVILDWVPGHFATDQWALARFDGQPLYEHPDPRKGWHQEWGSNIFDYGRPEVRNFLVANATYWLEEFHIDGLRVDGVASMLYLDYSRKPGEWIPNVFGGRENLEAVQLLQETNATAYKRTPGVVTIAEESTSWPGVTHPTDANGLGFGFKWNMGWMNDSLRYLGMDPIYRQWHHGKLTFALMYAFTENFVLPISHDEVVHGKGSLLRKTRGSREDQVATVRAYLAYMWSQPGKQLLFMGCEFGQESEWSEGRSLDWWLLDQPLHYRIHNQVKEMNAVYRSNPALWQLDHSPAGFRWLDADDAGHNTLSYLRFGEGDPATDAPVLAVVVNFSGATHEPYRIGLPRGGRWRVVLDTAGFHPGAPSSGGLVLEAEPEGWNGLPYAVNVTVPRLSTVWLAPEEGN
ncbi:MAG TPA: 1,4-alpha-glucan branching protein GlgB [Dermatophilaceae bacterium]|nr:1,4-alpha-glucan branching protein GlgB [Dermatophilaceae bacterium]